MGDINIVVDSISNIFIENYMYDLMYDDMELANISFNFKEEEAKVYLKNKILNTIGNNITKKDKLYKAIDNINYSKPVMEISDYKKFFYLIHLYIGELVLQDYEYLEDNIEEKIDYVFKYIWLKMTPDDFKEPEKFLLKNINMFQNTILDEYREETKIDGGQFFNKYDVTAKCGPCETFDEGVKTMMFKIKKDNKEITLPLVRYGIYSDNIETVCEIGSIQDKGKLFDQDYDGSLTKQINRLKYKLNANVDETLVNDVEPKKLMSLLLFIKLLKNNNINKIKIPSMYVLDFDYHAKSDKREKLLLESRWDRNSIDESTYEEMLKKIDKKEMISKSKTTDYIKLFERLIYHINDVDIKTYPMEVDSYLTFDINSYDNIIGDNVKKILK